MQTAEGYDYESVKITFEISRLQVALSLPESLSVCVCVCVCVSRVCVKLTSARTDVSYPYDSSASVSTVSVGLAGGLISVEGSSLLSHMTVSNNNREAFLTLAF